MITVSLTFNRPQGDMRLTSVTHSGKIDVITDLLGNLVVTVKDKAPWVEERYPLSSIRGSQIKEVEVGS